MNGLKTELDSAKSALDKNYGTVDLKPKFQQVWDQLNKAYNIYGMGWLQMNPQRLRINNLFAKMIRCIFILGFPPNRLSVLKNRLSTLPLYLLSVTFSRRQGFSVYIDAVLNYDSLSTIMNRQLANKEFDFKKGPVKKKFIIQDCKLVGEGNEKLIIRVNFGGTNEGTVYLTGKPVYNKEKRIMEIKDIDFDIKSKNALLKSAEWLFSKRITNEISKYTKFDLTSFIDTAKATINQQLNREWIKGIRSYGNMEEIKLVGIYPLSQLPCYQE